MARRSERKTERKIWRERESNTVVRVNGVG
jgi:hypothetical protein